ncbi:MAG: UDP-N-acetylmuramoyl-L-alanine--D-glutamate ligase [Lachnospiraceae bacterium]|nr:UDP-N-acetylmuramoyl-L-alanine--D-glutamate ligase [Lachnospiraceae bacterium]
MKDIRNLNNFLVVGAGRSGEAASKLLIRNGKNVILFDGGEKFSPEEFIKKNPELKSIKILTGELNSEDIKTVDAAVLSPGVPLDSKDALTIKDAGIKIIGEVELAYGFSDGKTVGITGTNGKTTTTALTGELMKTFYPDVHVVGNIGIPYTTIADETGKDSVTVAEISSFMLETTDEFHPEVTAILNITPDHLDRHHSMENYIKAKENIINRQTKDDTCVLNYEDPELRRFAEETERNGRGPKVVFFSSERELNPGLYVKDGHIFLSKDGSVTDVIDVHDLQILGKHNYENAMAAIAMADALSVPMDKIREGLKAFTAVEHRIEYVCEKRGVRFYNDSKGTNPDAAIKAVEAMDRPTILIGGGYDKKSSYDEWIESFGDKVKKLVLIGVTKEKIAECAESHGFKEYEFAETLEEAIDKCYEAAKSGDAVLLSPACASWDMFKSFEERGRIFKEYARSLSE